MFNYFKKAASEKQKDILIVILHDAKKLLSLPQNDYAFSSWENTAVATKEIDEFVEAIKNNQKLDILTLEMLFAPTGPIQEVSLSSGWGKDFLKLAERFDYAIKAYK